MTKGLKPRKDKGYIGIERPFQELVKLSLHQGGCLVSIGSN